MCKWLVEAGVDAIHASTGGFFPHPQNPAGSDLPVDHLVKTYDTMISSGDWRLSQLPHVPHDAGPRAHASGRQTVPKPEEIEGLNLPDARRVKEAVSVPVICTGGFQTASFITAALERGDCDAVSIARPLIANNDLVEIFRRGQDRADRPCTYCNKCLVNVVENPLGCYEEDAISVSRSDDRRDHVGVHAAAVSLTTPRRESRWQTNFLTSSETFSRRSHGMSCRVCWRMAGSFEMRTELRKKNLHDTEEPPEPRQEIPAESRSGHAEPAIGRRHAQRSELPEDGIGRPSFRAQLRARAHVPGHGEAADSRIPAWSAGS